MWLYYNGDGTRIVFLPKGIVSPRALLPKTNFIKGQTARMKGYFVSLNHLQPRQHIQANAESSVITIAVTTNSQMSCPDPLISCTFMPNMDDARLVGKNITARTVTASKLQ